MTSVCIYFQVHQPKRLRHYTIFDMYHHHDYEDIKLNDEILQKVINKCYLPTNHILEKLIHQFSGKFKIAFSLSGVLIEQLRAYPVALDSFKRLADTGCVEFLNETYHHSLSFIYSENEFIRQVKQHKKLIEDLFNQQATIFRNTELIYNNQLAACIEKLGYKGLIAEGADKILLGRDPNYVFNPINTKHIKLLLKNYRLSDDIAFRFSNPGWQEYPLTASKYAHWLHTHVHADVVNLFMDYETFGEHHWVETGIHDFLLHFPEELFKKNNFDFAMPSEAVDHYPAVDVIDAPYFYSWADTERDLTAWLGNELQQSAIENLYKIENAVYAIKDPKLIQTWQNLQTSDHFYYMCIKWHADGDVHKYFSPFPDPYEAFISYQNILNDFTAEVNEALRKQSEVLIDNI